MGGDKYPHTGPVQGRQVTREVKKEVRRTMARLGQLNAILVGRFPHRTDLIEEVSEAYLDGIFITGGGEGAPSARLTRFKKVREPSGKEG